VFNAVRARRRRRFFHLFVPAADGMSFFQADARDGFTLCHASSRAAIFLSFPAKIRHLSAHATISVGVYGSLSPNSAFKRNVISTAVTAFPGFPEYPIDVILKA
jgi:hypothetical protein